MADTPGAESSAPPPTEGFDFKKLTDNETFRMAVLVTAALLFAFWPFVTNLPSEWFAEDTYYAHGSIVPLCAAFIIWDRWEKIRNIPLSSGWLALVFLLPALYLGYTASRTESMTILSAAFVIAMFSTVVVVAGVRWMLALSPALLYLIFALPVWRVVIDKTTTPLQNISSDIAYVLLGLIQLNPFREQLNIISLDNFTLNIAEACSGVRLTLAVVAISVFFTLIAKLRWWGNLTLLALAVPISVGLNGVRITLIGIVGNVWGEDAGIAFHDYSGYISLVICFIILYFLTRKLGWK